MMETVLVLRIPEAEALVSSWRLKYDSSAIHGMPAHVTVLFPFRPFEAIDSHCAAKLASIFSASASFDLRFWRLGRFTGTLWLAPEPGEPIVQFTNAVAAAFPDCQPYGGAFPEPIPHLTVAQGDEPLLDNIAGQLVSALATPIHSRVAACSLFAREPDGWREKRRFPLLGASAG
ncbi:MAG: 2'-5' RNA ligase family protein [Devosia sp.]